MSEHTKLKLMAYAISIVGAFLLWWADLSLLGWIGVIVTTTGATIVGMCAAEEIRKRNEAR